MNPVAERILDTALALAEKGGFQAVKLRDVAEGAGVALGSLYKHFRSKEDILVAVLEREVGKLETVVHSYPPQGETPVDRASGFFRLATQGIFGTPNLARALLRSVASGEPEVAEKVDAYHRRVSRLIAVSLRGTADRDGAEDPNDKEEEISYLLQQIWFASLVGWMGGLHDEATVVEQMDRATRIVILGAHQLD